MIGRNAEERLILARAALIKAEEARERKSKLRAERKARGTLTRGREIDNGFRQYIRRQPCEARHLGPCSGPVQHAHVSYRVAGIPNSFGRGVKNHDRHANPLCRAHHDMQHGMKEQAFWELIGKDAYETAAAHFAEYQGQGTAKSLRQSTGEGK